MKLLRYGTEGFEKPGILDENGIIRDLSALIPDLSPAYLNDDILHKIRALDIMQLPQVMGNPRIAPCIAGVGKIACVGLNSKLHAAQMGSKLPEGEHFVVFLKATSAICGANDPLLYTNSNQKVDWEVELAVVIGKKCKNVEQVDALNYVLGYTCMNDVSDRFWQYETGGPQYAKGKSFDSFAPLGPYLVTKDEVSNPHNLRATLSINGEIRQDFSTSDYLHGVEEVISYMSKLFTLHPGDVVSLGTGPGNAAAWGYKYLHVGDKIRLEIEGIGIQEQTVTAD